MDDGWQTLRREVAIGCRVMAHCGLVENILGHISVRVEGGRALVRCRGPAERGLLFTTLADVRLVDLKSGEILDDPALEYAVPAELPIHTSVLLANPNVDCVVHAHPPDVVAASMAGIVLEPIFGAYDIPAARLAATGIPLHPRSVLIRTNELAAEMTAALGNAQALVLKGHGVVTTGTDVPDAVLRALQVDTLARLHLRARWAASGAGAIPAVLPEADLAELPDLGSAFNRETLWRFRLAVLEQDGLGLS